MASLAQWTWVWANSGRWWRTSGIMLQSMWSQRVGHDSNWTTTGNLIIWSFNYKLKWAQNFDFVMLAWHCLDSFANCRPWGFSISLLILKSASKFSVFPEYRVFSFLRSGYLLTKYLNLELVGYRGCPHSFLTIPATELWSCYCSTAVGDLSFGFIIWSL